MLENLQQKVKSEKEVQKDRKKSVTIRFNEDSRDARLWDMLVAIQELTGQKQLPSVCFELLEESAIQFLKNNGYEIASLEELSNTTT